ncbi:MAG: SpoIIE family protein phosphatase [Planctomycetota bacterium]|nr:SpoIIE family protein phosphatase [Planctomycetota bacterium]
MGATPDNWVLVLEPLAGPAIGPDVVSLRIDSARPQVLGRGAQADLKLPDVTVSRRHAQIALRGDTWVLTDLESRHGTVLNGLSLTPTQPAPLADGDTLRIGPWTFRVRDERETGAMGPRATPAAFASRIRTSDDAGAAKVLRIPPEQLALKAQARFDLLAECAAAMTAVDSERELAALVLDTLLKGTGFPRAALIREASEGGERVEIVAMRAAPGSGSAASAGPMGHGNLAQAVTMGGQLSAGPAPWATPQLSSELKPGGPGSTLDVPMAQAAEKLNVSRTLLEEAKRTGQVVKLDRDAGGEAAPNYGQSVISLSIHTAICAPLMMDSTPLAYAYLDARQGEGSVAPDAAAFTQAMAKVSALALSNLKRRDLELRQRKLERDLIGAREAQRFLMPPAQGRHGRTRYVMRSQPGRIVAGDLFDVIALPGERFALLLGDVEGKGLGAGVMMAWGQTLVRTLLSRGVPLAEALAELNTTLLSGELRGRMISLWAGLFDTRTGEVEFVDAGHGHWLLRRASGGGPETVACEGSVVLGVVPNAEYATERLALSAGDRLIVYSDGLREQLSPAGEEFGLDRIREALASAQTPVEDVSMAFGALYSFAAPSKVDALVMRSATVTPGLNEIPLTDDVTVVSVTVE